ncbi:MAG TPA: ribonuclease Y, partial [bacterium]|nr:ribonuclease Y [bacterium]
EQTAEITVSVLAIPSEEMKGRIIGREGRNIREFERITGVDLIIDDTLDVVVLSAFDPVRREIARQSLERLIADGRIQPNRIEQVVKKVQSEMEKTILEAGEQACFEVGLAGLPEQEVRILGRLKYRTSFGQNVLQHSVEVAHLAGAMAAEIGANIQMAKRVGLLHDLGKAIDQENEGSHASLGADLARKAGEPEAVVNGIAGHHAEVEIKTVEGVLVQAADAISAARPGARRENVQNYIKRLEKLESLSESFKGVEKSFAIQAGRELRVMVHADQLKDNETEVLARDLAGRIEKEVDYPGQIKVTVIREFRVVEYAK